MAIAIDGTAFAPTETSSPTVTLTTTSPGDVIAIFVVNNNSSGSNVTSISSTNTSSWARRSLVNQTTTNSIELWYGLVTNPSGVLSSEVITITAGSSADIINAGAFGISGVPRSSYFDTHSGLPATTTTSGGTVSISTSNANDLIISGYRSNANITNGTGWTQLFGGTQGRGFWVVQYQIVSTAQTSLVANTSSNTQNRAGIGDAIIAATAVAGCIRGSSYLLGVGCAIWAAKKIEENRVLTRRTFVFPRRQLP